MACSSLSSVLLLASSLSICFAANVVLQADDSAVGFDEIRKIPRSNAGNLVNLLMKNGESLNINFCVEFEDTFQLQQVNFSNDGSADVFTFELDGVVLGNVTTENNPGQGFNWNFINQSDPVGEAVTLSPGEHVITVTLTAENSTDDDGYGAEIDAIDLQFEDTQNGDLACAGDSTTDGSTTEGSSTTVGDEESTTDATQTTFSTTEESGSSSTSGSDCEGDYC